MKKKKTHLLNIILVISVLAATVMLGVFFAMLYFGNNGDVETSKKKYRIENADDELQRPVITEESADDIPPEIELMNEEVTLIKGDEYQETGAVAIDNKDGVITDRIKIDGEVDTSETGVYRIQFSVKDEAGNETQAEKKVTVINPVTWYEGEPNGKTIYLTFDDGPCYLTPGLLKTLDKYNVKATFFVVMNEKWMDVLKDTYRLGHSIGVHSATHDYATIYTSKEAYIEDFKIVQDAIYERTGMMADIYRFPGGSSNTVSCKYCDGVVTDIVEEMNSKGYQYFDWTLSSSDGGAPLETEEIYDLVTSRIEKSSSKDIIVLQHDIKKYSVDAVEDIILWAYGRGYSFAALTKDSPAVHFTIAN